MKALFNKYKSDWRAWVAAFVVLVVVVLAIRYGVSTPNPE